MAKPQTMLDMDVTKMLADFKVPGLDVDSILTSQRRNLETLAAANRTAFEGMQAVMKRQMEILRQLMEEAAAASRDMAEPGVPQDKAAKQTQMVKETFERTVANLRELSEMVARSNTEAMDMLNKRFAQNLDEVRDMLLKSKAS